MKEPSLQDNNTKKSLEGNKKPGLEKYFSDQSDLEERFSGNALAGILEFLEPKDALNFMYTNRFIKNELWGGKTTQKIKEIVLEKLQPLLVKALIKRIVSLKKDANVLFGKIIDRFASNFYEQNFSQLDFHGLKHYGKTQSSIVFRMCHMGSPDTIREIITEMLRYVAFVNLIQWINSDEFIKLMKESIELTDELYKLIGKLTDKSVKSIYENILKQPSEMWIKHVKNIMKSYLDSDFVVSYTKNFLCGISYPISDHGGNIFVQNIYYLLDYAFPKVAENERKEITCKLLKFTTSRLIHLEKPSEKLCKLAIHERLILFFGLNGGSRFFANPKDFASYLNQTGDLEQLLFNPKIDFINLFGLCNTIGASNEHRKYLTTERDKAYFDKMLIMADSNKSRCEKATTFVKYYGWKWFVCTKDAFNGLYCGCTRAKDFLKTNFDTCCNKRRSKLNLNISLNQNENIPLLDNDNNQENNHEHQE